MEKDLFVKKMVRLLMKEQMSERNENEDHHTISIETKTFNQILLYILMEESLLNEVEISEEVGKKILALLDDMIEESRKEFEEVLALLTRKK